MYNMVLKARVEKKSKKRPFRKGKVRKPKDDKQQANEMMAMLGMGR